MEFIFSGLVLGLAGSLHCAGMCGPIALALPLKSDSIGSKIFSGFLYNIGRTTTYALMGAIFGLVGQGLHLFGIQMWVGIIMGSIMILSVLFPKLINFGFITESPAFSFVSKIKSGLYDLFTRKSTGTIYLIGVLNGFLPCGLVYIAIAGAIATGDLFTGIYFMTAFGLGTLPMLFVISMIGNLAGLKFRNKLSKFVPYAVVIVGAFFILRGLNLGIPFISPKADMIEQRFDEELKSKKSCNEISLEKEKLPCCK